MNRMLFLAAGVAAILCCGAPARADLATLVPSKDNTLFEPVGDVTSSGIGPDLYVGRTEFNGSRRAVLAFDFSTIPAGAIIESVTLNFRVTRTPPGGHQEDVTLHRLLADWGEGASNADGGDGDPAQSGDATWLHRFYPDALWSLPGGDFDATVSGTRHLAGNGAYSVTSATMLADVQAWLANPSTNFGWIMIGDESQTQTARRLGSSENTDPTLRPNLLVTYAIPEPATIAILFPATMLIRRRRP